MSASKAAEMIVHHTQAASYHQGREAAYAEAMRLVRTLKVAAPTLPMGELVAMIERTEQTLYDQAQRESTNKDARNKALREASEALVTADNAIRTR